VISVDSFTTFVNEVHGPVLVDGQMVDRRPFPWQTALLHRVVDEGRWPTLIDVPTSLGKTSVIDVAVFAAALSPIAAPRRMFFIVDRRLVVDEAFEHAQRLQSALRQGLAGGDKPVSRMIAKALAVPGVEDPVGVTRMRGGITWDRLWVERPDQFAVVTGTVDQIGSRLLFRGYGVSEYARSIDGGLAGADSLIIVDEAHLAEAFHSTLAAAFTFDASPLARPPVVVAMSATSRPGQHRAHTITTADEQDPRVAPRLHARKLVRLVEVGTTKKKAAADMSRAMAALSGRLADRGVVGALCNTVGRARAVFSLLRDGDTEAVLLTGRSRPIGRSMLMARYYERIKAGRDRTDAPPLIVVATQTIEVGANIDFDAAVIESTALPSLIQRLGRVNRLGLMPSHAPVYLVHDSTVDADDPIYGAARLSTWDWLTGLAPVGRLNDPDGPGLDASPAALRTLRAQAPEEAAQVPVSLIPTLTRETLDEWARTSPELLPATPVAPFLHGMRTEPAPVTVLWRTGLPADHPQRWQTVVDAVPPAAEESIDVPHREVHRWLLGQPAAAPVADVDAIEASVEPPLPAGLDLSGTLFRVRDQSGQPLILRYRGRGDGELVPAGQIRPGDTIVVPGEYGGCDDYGWSPDSSARVTDLADLTHRRDRTVLRLGPHLRDLLPTGPVTTDTADRLDELLNYAYTDPDGDRATGYRQLLSRLASALDPGHPLRSVLDALTAGQLAVTTTRQIDPDTGASWQPTFPVVLSARLAWHADEDSEAGSSASAYPGKRISLDNHQRAVAVRAREFGGNLRLPPVVVNTLALAARRHDEGKRDPRFQTMLHGGNRFAADIALEPLAKSGIDPNNRAEAIRARRAAGYPSGMRHEALSAAFAARELTHGEQPPDIDPDLLLHLIASHHGRNRPLLPPVVDPSPLRLTVDGRPALDTADTVDWDSPARFAALNARYGRWGLALCETVLRLADVWCSARDEEATDEPTA